MHRQTIVSFLGLAFLASALGSATIDPRGGRPVEHGYKPDKCEPEISWPFCSDLDWGFKCPSGCRIMGLMNKYDNDVMKRVERLRHLLDQNKANHRSADQVTKETYDYLKDKLIVNSGQDTNYYDLAQNLRRRIVEIKIKIDRQLKLLAALKERVKDQVKEMQRLEVDIDIKLRYCKGSCKGYADYSVDKESYVELEKKLDQLEASATQTIDFVGSLHVMKSRPVKNQVVDSHFKSGLTVETVPPEQQGVDIFGDVKTMEFVFETEGSSASSPATVSKTSGTSSSSSHSSSGSSSFLPPPFGSIIEPVKPITEIVGHENGGFPGGFTGGFESINQPSTSHVTTSSTSCSHKTRKTTTFTGGVPVERTVTEVVGGPECQEMGDNVNPGFDHTSSSSTTSGSSSSSVTTQISHSSAIKGSLFDNSKSPFDMSPFKDLGLNLHRFTTDIIEDVPDLHARSVKSIRVEREADYVGKDCADIQQKHLNGETSGLFKVKPGGLDSKKVVEVYCEHKGFLGGWLLVQQRESGELSFNRTWAEYRAGFGSVDAQGKGELWLGNENLHLLTSQGETMLRVDLEDWEGGVARAEYMIKVGSEAEGFPLQVSQYSGDAGDSLINAGTRLASYLSHDGMKFSTYDRDNDKWEENCAIMYGGGWWYNNCQSANLNGIYYRGQYDPESNTPYEIENGVIWSTYKPVDYSLKVVRMLIRTVSF